MRFKENVATVTVKYEVNRDAIVVAIASLVADGKKPREITSRAVESQIKLMLNAFGNTENWPSVQDESNLTRSLVIADYLFPMDETKKKAKK